MNKYFIFAVISFLLIPFSSSTQAPAIEWQNTIGGTGYDFLNSIDQTSDGGYIMGGYSDSNIGGDKSENNIGGDDYWIVKLNAAGNIEWENTVGGGNFDRFYSVEETPDGGYILGGQSLSGGGVGDKSESNMGGYDYWVVKLNSDGSVAWDNAYGGVGNDQLYNAQPTSDGGYILAGSSDTGLGGDKTDNKVGNTDFWIIKLDAAGNIVWQNDLGGVMFDIAYSAYETTDGGYIIGGTSTSGISGDKTQANFGFVDYWVVKINSSGVYEWDKTFGGASSEYLYSAIPTADGGSILVGMADGGISGNKTEASNGLYDFWLIKLDALGNISWQNSIGGSGQDYVFVNPVVQTSDNGYIVAGYSQSAISGDKTEANTGSWDYWILKLTAGGSITWQTVLGGSGGDYANAINTTADGGYIVGGYSYSGATGEKSEANIGDADYWVMKLEGTGCVPFTEICNGIDDNCNAIIDEGITETISISAGGATTFCQGGNVLLTAVHTGTSLQWKRNGSNIPGATSATYLATTKGTYTCQTTSTCDTELSSAIAVNVIKNPPASITAGGATTFCAGGSVILTANAGGGLSYQWYKGASLLAGATSINYTATIAGNYKCRVTKTATGCFKNSNVIAVSVPCKEGERLLDTRNLQIFPNPNNGNFTVISDITGKGNIEILNSLGQVIYSKVLNSENGINENISIPGLPGGIYLIRVISEESGMEQLISIN
ncbi:MAG: T9SS type A sorting domain-containing protein [Bacteroidetes bacterium]|jgi:hypothetical protein|nr:T9SS type A sorting domain-containing protein [Bacteroidota bacterium]MBK7569125.1 T9SS type A sorting domain-containing protein [Bacteroidota bacterium]MBP8915211.1 T9SS type A sorting domain-containing protein [Chitinophagales bacterium]MBP9794501.1 T9SS type A sorting domain-containing protein [Chitinophagales bacterium]